MNLKKLAKWSWENSIFSLIFILLPKLSKAPCFRLLKVGGL